jgi:hypothetical protein
VGVIAQEVEKVYPQLVSTDEKTGLKAIQYGNLVGPIIEAIKELGRMVEGVVSKNDRMEKQLMEQGTKIADQEKTIKQLQEAVEQLQQK